MRRGWLVPPLLVPVALSWGCEGGRSFHAHAEPHGAPMTAELAEFNIRGPWIDSLGETNLVLAADCKPGENGQAQEPNTHFRCELEFADGEPITRVFHVLENDQLIYED